jgi:hypothetical protein
VGVCLATGLQESNLQIAEITDRIRLTSCRYVVVAQAK